ncbi:glycosyltransferase family 2 protein [Desulfovibrio sp. ZJ200]|uniref:glycosyltransferase family 2 protein n=1 Tax=Desulfovibrio sp. ZJ200 TaxID=2709792 RepID=UPI0013EC7002|nr:glycosyltransferase family 2 protein [Desulfovibrio sp. ZJ200]
MAPLVSFCIPTYNGMAYFPELMETLLPQLDGDAEIIISDDCSSDGTYEYALELQKRDTRIHVYRNAANLGMDGNFHQAVNYATGTYIWFSGQDDRFGKDAYMTFRNLLIRHPDTDCVYFNYRQYFSEPTPHYGETYLPLHKDFFSHNADEYFARLDRAPSFLPAIVMRRDFWQKTDLSPFYGTLYIQVGCWLLHAKDAHVYVVADPTHIDCRCPLDSWKYTDGTMWYKTKIGTLATYCLALDLNPQSYPRFAYEKIRSAFLRELPFDGIFFKAQGMQVKKQQRKLTRLVFGRQPLLYYGYVLPLLFIPRPLACLVARCCNNRWGQSIFHWLRRTLLPFRN